MVYILIYEIYFENQCLVFILSKMITPKSDVKSVSIESNYNVVKRGQTILNYTPSVFSSYYFFKEVIFLLGFASSHENK